MNKRFLDYLNLIKKRMEDSEINIMVNAYKELELLDIEKERIEFKSIISKSEKALEKLNIEKNVIEFLITELNKNEEKEEVNE